ncbi:MAG: CxxC-x17-CxxC domain-containing protein [Candidatus Woesearchaeota archaeon]
MAFEKSERRGSREGGRSSGRESRGSREGGRSSSFGGRSSSRDRPSGRSSRGSSEMYSAVCDKCGANCELPFKPTMGKPVLCSDCFRKEGPSRSKTDTNIDLSEINAKLDKILELLSDD